MNITFADLEIAAKIIQRASKAGLFTAEELSAVGEVYNKFKDAVEEATKQDNVANGENNE